MKKLLIVTVFITMLTACVSKKLKVEIPKIVNAEYGEELSDDKLFDVKKSDEKIKVKKVEDFDKNKVGEQIIKVTFTDGNIETTKEIKIAIKDTKKPIIELNKKEIKIQVGDKLDIKKNIKKVSDPVDGELKYSEKEIKENGYRVDKGSLDLNKIGTYEVKVIAYDKNKNKTESVFKIVVEKKKEIHEIESTGVSESKNPQVSQNTSISQNISQETNSSVAKPSIPSNSNNKPAPSKPKVHKHHPDVSGYENDNLIMSDIYFNTFEEAGEWADNYENPNWASWGYSVAQCSCGMWTPYFFNIVYKNK